KVKILYSAIDQTVPGTKGGSVHVTSVAEGLAALGHDVTALVTPGSGTPNPSRVRWVGMTPPFGSTHLRLAKSEAIARLAREMKPDAIIERYHNFGGEAIRVAAELKAVAILEVNAPVIDHPGSPKALLDRALLVQPMRRWREHLCRIADIIITPNPAIVPWTIPREQIRVLEWGADTDRFKPGVPEHTPFVRLAVTTVAVFAGAFRSWHGAIHLVNAIKILRERERKDIGAVFVGDGPELSRVRAAAKDIDTILITGALPHHRMPAVLASADIGVAPFDLGAHAPLSLGFYWSPLKIFEYMASGLPVVAPAVDRIPALVANGREGLLYGLPPKAGSQAHAVALADSLERLSDPVLRRTLGAAARERAMREYSWAAHCRAIESAITDARGLRAVR
ncbi:MAG TPA: glycosyltransferase family 4 protein, partial [Vicinamibacterales bacterium]|nr:glycosyltransferase family 4 protein [Vicinamibacterales bacterium]